MELHRPNATRCPSRSFLRRVAALALLTLSGISLIAGSAHAGAPGRNGIVVVQVKGLLDVPNVSLLRETIAQVNEDERTLLIIQLDARGVIADIAPVLVAIERSRVPVVAWIGPPGAQAKGGASLLAQAAHATFIASGSTIGPRLPLRLDKPSEGVWFGYTPLTDEDPDPVRAPSKELDARDAVRKGVVDGQRPTVGEVITKLNRKTLTTAAGEVELRTAKVIGEGQDRRRQPNQEVAFVTLDLGGQVQHILISPAVAYAFLVLGLALIVFEFFAASVGFGAFVGAVMLLGGFYGFSHLPVHWWAVALLFLSAFGFAVDAQAGGSGFWTAVGGVTLVAGTFTLYGGHADLAPPWWGLIIVMGMVVVFSVFAVPAFIRARFSTPTVGREGMIGELGTAEVAVDPDGVVVIRDARWRARTNRATPVAAGDRVRVIAVEGLVLEVEPEAGGARDYRERGRKKKKD